MTDSKLPKYKSLQLEHVRYRTLLTNKFSNRRVYEPVNLKLVYSFIPGTIIDIFVKEGQEVKEGERMLILEAMKMRNDVGAPMDGKIKKIQVETGQKVPKNQLMIEFE